MGFFNIKNIFKKYFKDCFKNDELIKSILAAIITDRNTGKTTSSINFIIEQITKKNKLFCYIRNTQKAAENYINEFVAINKEYYIKNKNLIFRTIDNKLIGYVCSISTYLTQKSGIFENVEYILYDEFDEPNIIKGLYKSFISLLKTIQRFKKICVIMLANRENANNEFMTNWAIEPREPNNKNDIIITLLNDDENKAIYFDFHKNTFKTLNNSKTLSDKLAMFNKNTKNYLDGFYMIDDSIYVKNFNKWIEPTFKPIFGLCLNEIEYIIGEFYLNNIKNIAIVYQFDLNKDYYYKSYSIDIVSKYMTNTQIEQDFLNDIIDKLLNYKANKQLFYSHFDLKNEINNLFNLYKPTDKITF